ncbi:MAG: AAA family ATPase [Nitrospirae bacterium]|nr:AAA family ATPase [Nitrospirota bacterium]
MADGQKKAKVISFINFKGGVGKTSNTVNIAGELAHNFGKRVLVIDMDPQANASVWLMGEDRFFDMYRRGAPPRQTVLRLFTAVKNSRRYDIDDAIIKNVYKKDSIAPVNLDLLPAEYGMINLDLRLTSGLALSILKTILHNDGRFPLIRDRYDFILIDCPPSLSILTCNALLVSDFYIVPTIPNYLSRIGLNILSSKIKETVASFKPDLILLGIILNLGNPQAQAYHNAVRMIERDLKHLKEEQIVDNEAKIFKPPIRNLIGIAEAAENNILLFDANGGNYGTPKDLYQKLAQDILSHPYL